MTPLGRMCPLFGHMCLNSVRGCPNSDILKFCYKLSCINNWFKAYWSKTTCCNIFPISDQDIFMPSHLTHNLHYTTNACMSLPHPTWISNGKATLWSKPWQHVWKERCPYMLQQNSIMCHARTSLSQRARANVDADALSSRSTKGIIVRWRKFFLHQIYAHYMVPRWPIASDQYCMGNRSKT